MFSLNSYLVDNFSIPKALLAFIATYIAYSLLTALYNITLHPLAGIPGSKLYAAFYFPGYYHMCSGSSVTVCKQQHEKHGPVIRITPNRLSFTTAQAFTDIHITKRGAHHYPLEKDTEFYSPPIPEPTQGLISVDAPTHKRQRKLLSYAFSEAALRDQEDIVHHYCDLLISRLHEQITGPEKGKVDIARWFNFTTFDIIGDLAFAEPFHSLENSRDSIWLTLISENLIALGILRATRAYPLPNFIVQRILKYFPSQAVTKLKADSTAKMARRLDSKTDRKDFTSHFMKHNRGIMTSQELTANADLFIVAGSETSATLLSGLVFLLTKNPATFDNLRAEVDAAFNNASDMTFTTEARLPYLHACIEEALRVYPPVPIDLPRLTPPEGATIDGIFVPGNTSVGVHQLSTYHSELNFKDATEFHPERWLGDNKYAGDNLAAAQPFSVGPRNCIGKGLAYAEMRSIMARIVWNFEIELSPDCGDWMNQKSYALWLKTPLIVTLKARNH